MSQEDKRLIKGVFGFFIGMMPAVLSIGENMPFWLVVGLVIPCTIAGRAFAGFMIWLFEEFTKANNKSQQPAESESSDSTDELSGVLIPEPASNGTWSDQMKNLRRQFKTWQAKNPDIATEIGSVLTQFKLVKREWKIRNDLISGDAKRAEQCADCLELTNKLLAEIFQNFADISNILILAGANQGEATAASLDNDRLASELNSNLKRIGFLHRLNEQILCRINQNDDVMQEVATECAISAIEDRNARIAAAAKSNQIIANGGSAFVAETTNTKR